MLDRMRYDADALPIARAVSAALRKSATAEEKAWFDRIDAQRDKLIGRKQLVTVTDYGAGKVAESDDSPPDPSRSVHQVTPSQRRVELGRFYKLSEVDAVSSRILFHLVRALAPQRCIELGTCTGLSAAHQAAALTLNGSGRLITIEGSQELATRASATLASLGLTTAAVRTGSFETVLPGVATELEPVDYVFNDGHHLEEPTVEYFRMLLPSLAPGATIVLDDINWSQGMRRAWKRILAHECVALSVNLYRMGVIRVTTDDTDVQPARHYRWR
jgi:predicted O-methyltransferase YrrM